MLWALVALAALAGCASEIASTTAPRREAFDKDLVKKGERLAALGGDLELVQAEQAGAGESRRAALRLLAWLPDRLDALLEDPVVGAAS